MYLVGSDYNFENDAKAENNEREGNKNTYCISQNIELKEFTRSAHTSCVHTRGLVKREKIDCTLSI